MQSIKKLNELMIAFDPSDDYGEAMSLRNSICTIAVFLSCVSCVVGVSNAETKLNDGSASLELPNGFEVETFPTPPANLQLFASRNEDATITVVRTDLPDEEIKPQTSPAASYFAGVTSQFEKKPNYVELKKREIVLVGSGIGLRKVFQYDADNRMTHSITIVLRGRSAWSISIAVTEEARADLDAIEKTILDSWRFDSLLLDSTKWKSLEIAQAGARVRLPDKSEITLQPAKPGEYWMVSLGKVTRGDHPAATALFLNHNDRPSDPSRTDLEAICIKMAKEIFSPYENVSIGTPRSIREEQDGPVIALCSASQGGESIYGLVIADFENRQIKMTTAVAGAVFLADVWPEAYTILRSVEPLK